MSLNNIRQKNQKISKQQPSSPALQQRHSNTRFPPPRSQITPKTNSSPTRRRIPDERAVPFTQCPSPMDPNSNSRLRLSTIISSGTGLEGASLPTQSCSPMTTRSNPVQQLNVPARRPPLPPNKKNSASAAFAWATSTTPRMRVPLTNQSGSIGSSRVELKRSSIEEIANQFHYKGPNQVYPGPPNPTCTSLAADGSEPLKWFPFRNSTHLLQPPPPPPKIVEDILGRQQDNQPQQQASNPSGTAPQQLSAEQHTFLKNLLQTARRLAPATAQEPWESHQGTPLLTASPSGEPGSGGLPSSSPSFPSNNTLNQLEQATLQQDPLHRTPSVGPFINNGIPNEIQDDLLRIELLLGLGLEKYKEAINQKIQNHNQIIQLVKSRSSQLNAQQSQSQQKFLTKYPHPPYPYPHYPLQPQQQVFPAIMDLQQNNIDNMDGGEEFSIPNVAKPVWSNHQTAEPFNPPDFTLNTFMEPHPEASSKGDQNANDQSPISLLKPINFDDFQALAEQSRSGFQSNEGMQQQQNPFLAGALQYQPGPLPYHFNQLHPPCPDLNLLEPEVTKAAPLHIQVSPRKESPPSPQPQEQPCPELPRKQSSVQQQYQEYLQQDENNLRGLSPNSFKVLEQPVDLMPRKPVAVAKALPRSPSNLFPTEGLTIVKATDKPNTAKTVSPAVSPPPVTRGATKKINLDKPSPFFPGFSEKPIQMKIKSPRTRTGGSSTGGQTITTVTSGAASRKLEGVEELGNLLSQLPVLSRKQKVEEFQAFSTIKPETPLTEGDSETSMIPLVSSNGTLISDRRPDSGQRGRRRVSSTRGESSGGAGSMKVEVSAEGITTDEEFTNLDTNKMSINELVTLGRKIYRILSQLSTNSNGQTTPPMNTPQKEPQQEHLQPNQVYTAPVTLNVPTPNTPVFTPKAKSIKTRGNTSKGAQGLPVSPALIVDFNSMPNPTFITGPGVNAGKNTPKMVPSSKALGGSRTPSQQQLPPNLFRNIVKPPPTRWGDKGKSSSSSAKKKPSKGRKISRRSTSSMMSATRAGTSGGKLKKSRASSFPNQQAEEVPIPKTMPTSFTVRENYNNNYTRKSSAKYKRRQPTPYPYPNPMDNQNPSGMTLNSNAGGSGMSRSLGRRNFIQENINKAAMMRQRRDSRVRPRQLPPVENYYRKMYDGVPSRIPGSRSRSNSIHRLHHYPKREKHKYPNQSGYLPHGLMMRRVNEQSTRRVGSRGGYDNRNLRSSSVPATATSHAAYSNNPYPSHYQQQRSLSTPRPSTGISMNMTSSSNKSESSIPHNNQNQSQTSHQASRPSSQGILKSSSTGNAKSAKAKNGASKVKFDKLPSKSSISEDNATPAPPPPEEVSQIARKSRSKTKRTNKDKELVENKATILSNQNLNDNNKVSPTSSAETQQQETPPPPPTPQPKKKIVRVKPKPSGKNRKPVSIPENLSTDNSDNEQKTAVKQPVFNSESDQKIIRNVVKEEIKLMVNRKVKKSINRPKHKPTPTKRASGGKGEEDFIKRRIHLDNEGRDKKADESSFQSGLRHRPVHSREDSVDSGEITPVYTPPKFYDESLFSLEKWVNPDIVPPGSAYTSDNDTPKNSASNRVDDNLNSVYGVVGGRVRHGKLASSNKLISTKPGVVRFSLPTFTNQMKIKTKHSK